MARSTSDDFSERFLQMTDVTECADRHIATRESRGARIVSAPLRAPY